MKQLGLLAALASGAVTVFLYPAVAQSGPRSVYSVPTRTQTFHRGLDALSDGRIAVLIQRRVARL